MTLDTNGAMFEFRTSNDDQFAKDYYQVVDTDIPLWAVKEELLFLMENHRIEYFKIPGTKTKDHRDHTFHFKIEKINHTKVKSYRYLYYD